MGRTAGKKKRSSAGAVKMVDASVLEKLREEAMQQLEADRRQKSAGKKARRQRMEQEEADDSSGEEVSMEEAQAEAEEIEGRDLLAVAAAGSELKAIQERQAKYFPNNAAAMDQALSLLEFKGPGGGAVPWVETLSLTSSSSHEEVDAGDDFARELSFYRQAVECCEAAALRFEEEGLRYRRPEDYFAEMLKTDAHMTKVRKRLLEQRQRIEAVEERRQQREMKKFGKQVQVAKEQARAKQRKQETEAIKKWRSTQKDADAINVERTKEEFDVMLDATAVEKEDKKTSTAQAVAAAKEEKADGPPRVNLKRKRKDEKYGFGGKKRRIKSNTRESTDAASEWSRSKNNAVDKDILRLVPKVGNQRAKKEQMLQRQQRKGKRR